MFAYRFNPVGKFGRGVTAAHRTQNLVGAALQRYVKVVLELF